MQIPRLKSAEFISETSEKPETVLLVGDTIHDYEVAECLNFRCLLVCGGHQSRDRLEECNCDVVKNIQEVLEYTGI